MRKDEVLAKVDRDVYKKLFEDSQKECMKYTEKYLMAHDMVIDLTDKVRDLERKNRELENKMNEYDQEYEEALEGVNDFWGDQMPMMAMEEAGEFIHAISKLERYLKNSDKEEWNYDKGVLESNVVEEMADMVISIGALMKRYEISTDFLNYKIDKKLNKVY